MSKTMEAITLMQPFATLMVIGEKTNETRSWPTTKRGTVAIHASARICQEFQQLCGVEPFKSVLEKAGYKSWRDLPTGAVLGTVTITGCSRVTSDARTLRRAFLSNGKIVRGNEYMFGDYNEGRYAWETQNPVLFETPIPAKGSLNFWKWEDTR